MLAPVKQSCKPSAHCWLYHDSSVRGTFMYQSYFWPVCTYELIHFKIMKQAYMLYVRLICVSLRATLPSSSTQISHITFVCFHHHYWLNSSFCFRKITLKVPHVAGSLILSVSSSNGPADSYRQASVTLKFSSACEFDTISNSAERLRELLLLERINCILGTLLLGEALKCMKQVAGDQFLDGQHFLSTEWVISVISA